MSDASARLIVLRGPTPNQELPLTQSKTTIGRSPSNDIALNDPEVSRRHAEIIAQGDGIHITGFSIQDMGSTNGTFVNSERITGLTPLQEGDRVELGETILLTFQHQAMAELDTQASQVVQEEDTAPDLPTVESAQENVPADEPMGLNTDAFEFPEAEPERGRRWWLWGCGCLLLLLVFFCGLLFFLDSFDNGRLLYCGPLGGLFESLLGPFGFDPACLLP